MDLCCCFCSRPTDGRFLFKQILFSSLNSLDHVMRWAKLNCLQHLYPCFGRWKAFLVISNFGEITDLFDWNVKKNKLMYTLIQLQMCQSNVTFMRMNNNNWANTCYEKSGSGRILPIEEWWKEFCSRTQCVEVQCVFAFSPPFFLFPITVASLSLIGHLGYQF